MFILPFKREFTQNLYGSKKTLEGIQTLQFSQNLHDILSRTSPEGEDIPHGKAQILGISESWTSNTDCSMKATLRRVLKHGRST